MEKSARNKTIRYADLDITRLHKRLTTPSSYSDIGPNQTVLGDCLEVFPYIKDGAVDLIIADPPYNLNKTFGATKFSSTDDDKYYEWVCKWLRECHRILKEEGSIYICCDWKSSPMIYKAMKEIFILKNRITWQREKGRGAAKNWKNNIEDIYFGVKNEDDFIFNLDAVKVKKRVIAPYKTADGEAKDWFTEDGTNYRMTCPSNIWTDITIPFWSMPENTEHPTQKPEKVLAKLILANSLPGDLVFDPFLGSGTTSVVAKKLGRRYLGVEQEEEYCIVSEHRLDMAEADNTIQGIENGVFLERNDFSADRSKSLGRLKKKAAQEDLKVNL